MDVSSDTLKPGEVARSRHPWHRLDRDQSRLGPQFHLHTAAGSVVVDGVADQVGDDWSELFRVAVAASGREFDFEGNTLFLGEGAQEFRGVAGDPIQVAKFTAGVGSMDALREVAGGDFGGVKSRTEQAP